MKAFENQAAQGDLLIRRIAALPAGVTPVSRKGQEPLVVAHSETGHHHAFLEALDGVEYFRPPGGDAGLDGYLVIPEGRTLVLKHLRPFDTHEELAFTGGTYHLRRQREFDLNSVEGWRIVED